MKLKGSIRVFVFFLFLVPVFILGVQRGNRDTSNEVNIVFAASAAHSSVLTLQPERLWHVGADGDEEFGPLGHIIDAVADREGYSYLLDESLVVVKKFDAQGNFIQDIGRLGEGPGEFNNPVCLNIFPDDNLGVFQFFPSRIVMLDKEGVPQGQFDSPETDYLRNRYYRARSSSSYTALSQSVSTTTGNVMTSQNSLQIYDASGNYVVTAIDQTKESPSRGMTIDDGTEYNGLATCWDISPDGRIFVAPYFDQYKILVFDCAGTKQATIQAEYNPVRRSAEQLAELEKENRLLQKVEGKTVDIYPYKRDISGLFCRPNSNMWVLSSRGELDCPENQLGIFHVFDNGGRYLYNLSLIVDYNPKRDSFRIDKDLLFILKESQMMPATTSTARFGNSMVITSSREPERETSADDGAEPFSVICYRLPQ